MAPVGSAAVGKCAGKENFQRNSWRATIARETLATARKKQMRFWTPKHVVIMHSWDDILNLFPD